MHLFHYSIYTHLQDIGRMPVENWNHIENAVWHYSHDNAVPDSVRQCTRLVRGTMQSWQCSSRFSSRLQSWQCSSRFSSTIWTMNSRELKLIWFSSFIIWSTSYLCIIPLGVIFVSQCWFSVQCMVLFDPVDVYQELLSRLQTALSNQILTPGITEFSNCIFIAIANCIFKAISNCIFRAIAN
jgi:hypothetical protein